MQGIPDLFKLVVVFHITRRHYQERGVMLTNTDEDNETDCSGTK